MFKGVTPGRSGGGEGGGGREEVFFISLSHGGGSGCQHLQPLQIYQEMFSVLNSGASDHTERRCVCAGWGWVVVGAEWAKG